MGEAREDAECDPDEVLGYIPMFIGATVLLPQGYDAHPAVHYPVLYEQGHFSLAAPMGFTT